MMCCVLVKTLSAQSVLFKSIDSGRASHSYTALYILARCVQFAAMVNFGLLHVKLIGQDFRGSAGISVGSSSIDCVVPFMCRTIKIQS
jgi:hypothetical protein